MKSVTYKTAGVDFDKANALVKDYKRFSASTKIKGVISSIGGFGGLFNLGIKKFKDPILVSSTDGVGTKLKIAFLADKHDTIGIDLVAMSTNDILCSGARGLFFLDYISTGKIKPPVLKDIVKGIARGCKEAGYALIGGETAEMPGMYKEGEYDLAGFGVGVVEKDELIDGSSINRNDIVIGLESSGLHSNGFSLVRKVLNSNELKKHAKELLKPTRLYSKSVLALKTKINIKGIANITGGAFYDKAKRIIPKGMAIEIDKYSWKVPAIFSLIQKKGDIEDREMYRTFNMGIGMVVVVAKCDAAKSICILKQHGAGAHVIGRVVSGNKEVVIL